jgi:hypothetical protein
MKEEKGEGAHTAEKCGAKLRGGARKGEPCAKPAGWGTDHVGQSRCRLHGGANPIKHGRYSKIARARLGDQLKTLEADPDPMDLLPEIQLIRASAMHFLTKHGPSPMVAELLEKAARIVDLLQKHKKTGLVTMDTLNRVVEQLGVTVAKHVKDPEVLAAIERDWGLIQLS